MNDQQLAEAVGVSEYTLRRFKRGLHKLTPKQLRIYESHFTESEKPKERKKYDIVYQQVSCKICKKKFTGQHNSLYCSKDCKNAQFRITYAQEAAKRKEQNKIDDKIFISAKEYAKKMGIKRTSAHARLIGVPFEIFVDSRKRYYRIADIEKFTRGKK